MLYLKILNGKEEKNNTNNNNTNNHHILKKCSSASNLKLNSKNFVYSKKKFLKIDKNGNNLLLNQFTSHRHNKIDNNRNMSMRGIKYNPLTVQNKYIINMKNKSKFIKNNNINFFEENINNNNEENKKIVFSGLNEKVNENINENKNKVNE